jgi:CBS domain-containing protein
VQPRRAGYEIMKILFHVGSVRQRYLRFLSIKDFGTKRNMDCHSVFPWSSIAVAPDENLHMILLLIADRELSRIVVTRNHKPVGIITGHDLLPLSVPFGTGTAGRYQTPQEEMISGRRNIPSGIRSVLLAEGIMKYDPITIARNSDLAQAAQIMTRNRISGLLVVGENSNDAGNVVGIITKTDIIKALASTTN